MVTGSLLKKYGDADFNDKSFKWNQIYRVVTGDNVVDVHGKLIPTLFDLSH